MRTELHPRGLEIVTVSLELSGPEASRPFIEAAAPDHPSLLDPTHLLDSLFGVVNIPNVIWIDEDGTIVRPPEPGWPADPAAIRRAAASALQGDKDDPRVQKLRRAMEIVAGGQDRATYADAIRDWVTKGAASPYRLTPAEVVETSQPRSKAVSQAAAHFELANHSWRNDQRAAALRHFNAANALQPENWTYKRQAWSLVGNERVGGDRGRFTQGPLPGEEADWPFASDWATDVGKLEPGQYYPKTF